MGLSAFPTSGCNFLLYSIIFLARISWYFSANQINQDVKNSQGTRAVGAPSGTARVQELVVAAGGARVSFLSLISLEPGAPGRLFNDNCVLLTCQPFIKCSPGKSRGKRSVIYAFGAQITLIGR